MLGKIVFLFSTSFICRVVGQGECTDVRGRLISHGHHYVPGPDTCTLCICDNGQAKVCKAVLCSPPQDCRSFRVGNTCCEFICLDDVVKPADGAEANMRLAAGGAAAVVLATVALVVYRVRRQKRRRPNHSDERSLTSIGYISGSMAYVGGSCETGMAGWKPSNYMPRGEAPPPYDEAVAQSRAETMRMGEAQFHRSYPATVDTMVRADDSLQCPGHGYANIARPPTQMANPQNCYNAPLLQTVHQPESREPMVYHHIPPPNDASYGGLRLAGSLGAISGRGLSLLPRAGPERRAPPAYTHHHDMHRTIPRIATDSTLDAGPFHRAERSLHNEVRRSFHKPSDTRTGLAGAGRSVPRGLNLTEVVRVEPSTSELHNSNARLQNISRSRIHSEEHTVSTEARPLARSGNISGNALGNALGNAPGNVPKMNTPLMERCKSDKRLSVAPEPPQNTLPLTVDKPSCECSYSEAAGGAGEAEGEGEGEDDYRAECQNCKSASSSRWVLEEGWTEEAEEEGTQTLQRRAPPPAPPPVAAATLPQPATRPSRNAMGPPSNWENWFNTIPDSDSESEEE
ncbi:uncharacterized protein LOC105396311 isoform X2 [Plutella xylostella]|uniref:uncharacterized protein LOC105396311 isoform X2 n=1 Tax=Plutella xylostella TaxID=51655 RepID=UPI002032FC30|nr:uncharacterized protein LOC105396311 isoform X2 [Plutella xylostella]